LQTTLSLIPFRQPNLNWLAALSGKLWLTSARSQPGGKCKWERDPLELVKTVVLKFYSSFFES